MLPGLGNPRLADSKPPKFYVTKAKVEFELHQLSDGERGLLALAFDLTRRLAIANPSLTNPVADGEAIILLDEVELHLHPGWQRKVLERLMGAFKSCQFIATTHSPQVLGEAPPKSVWILELEDGQITRWQPDRFFGLDSNQVLEEVMGTDAVNANVKRKLHEVSVLLDKDHYRKAEQAITELESKLGANHPELIRLRSLIAFMTGDE
jgi:predicted ATP-binding protein involved in virulence